MEAEDTGAIKITCRYFDGYNPLPIEGTLIFEVSRVIIELDSRYSGPKLIELESLEQFTINNNEVVMALSKDIPNQINPVFKFDCGAELEVIKKRVSLQGKKITGQSFLLLKPVHKIVSLFVLIVISVFLFQLSLDHIHKIVSVDIDKNLGDKVEKSLLEEQTILPAESLTKFLNETAQQLKNINTANLVLKVAIIDDPEINAFALPNGSIYFYRGLLEKSESAEEVIGILAHEIAHVENRHSMRQLIKSLGTMSLISMIVGGGLEGAEFAEGLLEISGVFLALKYSREFECEADLLAVQKLKDKSISVAPFAEFFIKLDSDSVSGNLVESMPWLSTHPLNDSRVEYIQNEATSQININQIKEPMRDWENFLAENGIESEGL